MKGNCLKTPNDENYRLVTKSAKSEIKIGIDRFSTTDHLHQFKNIFGDWVRWLLVPLFTRIDKGVKQNAVLPCYKTLATPLALPMYVIGTPTRLSWHVIALSLQLMKIVSTASQVSIKRTHGTTRRLTWGFLWKSWYVLNILSLSCPLCAAPQLVAIKFSLAQFSPPWPRGPGRQSTGLCGHWRSVKQKVKKRELRRACGGYER